MQIVPTKTTVLVIGGGPAGSYAASVLALENVQVVVLEAEKFPRYHIGESQLPSFRHFLRFIDLVDKFEEFGFIKKVGAAFKFNQKKREGYTDFTLSDRNNYAWNLPRAESDQLMLQHAAECGATVVEETRVTDIEFYDPEEGQALRPSAANWKNKAGGTGRIAFDYLVDASGRAGILSTKYLRNRSFTDELKNIAFWGYWTGCGEYMPGTRRAGAPYFEALTDESGWAWFIPLHDGTTSVGIVMNQAMSKKRRSELKENTILNHYQVSLEFLPSTALLMADAKMVQKDGGPLIRSASDYSYSASSHAGPNYRIVGDAGAFLDPFFSSGVHLALTGGLSAAATICAAIRGDCTQLEAANWHTTRVQTSYTRFLLVVLSAYKQMHAQEAHILSSETEDNFDTAFDHFKPIIQGTFESGAPISKDQWQIAIDFCSLYAWEPTLPEERARVLQEQRTGSQEDNATELANIRRIMSTRKLMRTEENIYNLFSDSFDGFSVRLKRGELGLVKQ